jgi:hypothetical protein
VTALAPPLLNSIGMKNSIVLIAIILFCGPLLAQTPPSYDVVYNTCISEDSPTEVKSFDTKWIVVVEGGDKAKVEDCEAYIPKYQAQHPKESNIRFKDIKREKSSWERGSGNKYDISCKFETTGPVKVASESEACGLQRIVRTGDVKHMSIQAAQACVSLPTNSQTALWRKLACLMDARDQAVNMNGIDATTYEDVKTQITIVSEALARGLNMPVQVITVLARPYAQEK